MSVIEAPEVILDRNGADLSEQVIDQMRVVHHQSRLKLVTAGMLAEDYEARAMLASREPSERERGGGDVSESRLRRVIAEDGERHHHQCETSDSIIAAALWDATCYFRGNVEAYKRMAEADAAAALALRQSTVYIRSDGKVIADWDKLVRV